MNGPDETSTSTSTKATGDGMHDESSSICVGCALCCDGTLFAHVNLQRDERPDTRRAVRVALHDDGSDSMLMQPCSCSVEGRCTIYEDRPRTCRAYRCSLLQRLEAGETTSAEARAVIQRTKARRDAVLPLLRTEVPNGQTMGFFRLHRELHARCDLADDPVAARADIAPLLLLTGAVHAQLVRSFYTVSDHAEAGS